MIDTYLKAYETAELDERVARVEQLTDAELMPIATGGHATEAPSTQPKLLILNSR